jgi:tRNA (mo5U34)-methyltransferase
MTEGPLPPDRLREAVAQLRWYQTIDLGSGVVTPGVSRSATVLERLELPASLTGKTVIDVGAADGFFAFECERRGAARVVAADSKHWSPRHWTTKAPFLLARQALRSRVEDYDIDVMDLTSEAVGGPFDITLFLGVLYHLKHPLLGLERIAAVTSNLLILETHADFLHASRPAIAFYPEAELSGDRSNWHGPNIAALKGMLRVVGFRAVEVVYCPPFHKRLARALWLKLRKGRETGGGSARLGSILAQGRVVVHARK